jgi:NADH-quinone oxidoreductase subunit M
VDCLFGIQYHLGVDGISMLFVILNSFTTLMVVLAGWEVIKKRQSQYMAAFLIMSGLINGAFAALDAILFYVFFEGMLIPMYLIIGVWGGPRRVYASFKFFLYTLLGSLLMLVALIYLYFQAGSFRHPGLPGNCQDSAARTDPAVHRLLPVFRREGADVAGAYLVAGCPRGSADRRFHGAGCHHAEAWCLRFPAVSLPILPDAARELSWIMVALSLVAVVYIGLVALVQTDMKKLVAYSSISHMGFVTLGMFMFTGSHLNQWAVEGALVQMVSHGFVSAACSSVSV